VAEDDQTRRKIAKEGRLYVLALVCATGGALGVYLSNRLLVGIFVFAVCLLIFGPMLYHYERRHRP
jgi:heme A synthase